MKSFVKTSGSRGLHVHVPLKPELHFDKVKKVAKKIAEKLHQQLTDITTMQQRKNPAETCVGPNDGFQVGVCDGRGRDPLSRDPPGVARPLPARPGVAVCGGRATAFGPGFFARPGSGGGKRAPTRRPASARART